MPEITESEKLRRKLDLENRTADALKAAAADRANAEKEHRLESREKRREVREWITLVIAILAFVLSILSLIWQHPLH